MTFSPQELALMLAPFLGGEELLPLQLERLGAYLDLLLRWNARINLTAVRAPSEIVTRHFGESFFAARQLLGTQPARSTFDFGSGAGFPGVPLAIYSPELRVTLIESHNKKSTFLKEVVRTCGLANVHVFHGRGEDLGATSGLVTMRAVEKFTISVPAAARLVTAGGRLAMLLGAAQAGPAKELLPGWQMEDALPLPGSRQRVLLVARK